MSCPLCTEFARHIQTAKEPVSPELLIGLTEAGKRNRAHQQEERIVKAQNDLARHQKSCVVLHGQPEAVNRKVS